MPQHPRERMTVEVVPTDGIEAARCLGERRLR